MVHLVSVNDFADFDSVSLDSALDPSLRLKSGFGQDDADEDLVDSVLLFCH
jgi:hypothetical protein